MLYSFVSSSVSIVAASFLIMKNSLRSIGWNFSGDGSEIFSAVHVVAFCSIISKPRRFFWTSSFAYLSCFGVAHSIIILSNPCQYAWLNWLLAAPSFTESLMVVSFGCLEVVFGCKMSPCSFWVTSIVSPASRFSFVTQSIGRVKVNEPFPCLMILRCMMIFWRARL